ncbi:hypothetical protein PIB30_013198 [Stylosanthes scabra]|uniref:Uncharacterized protein n=1 Tax=Stylosanthes scabra TaxID=79078 RepID=A0ABU6Z3Z7_9FABA|nr:hypothetical protein [Stylosanthes scabra]
MEEIIKELGLDKCNMASLKQKSFNDVVNTVNGNGLAGGAIHDAKLEESNPILPPRFKNWGDESSESAIEKTVRRVQVGRRKGNKRGKDKLKKGDREEKKADKRKKTTRKKSDVLAEQELNFDSVETISDSGSEDYGDSNGKQARRILKLGTKLGITAMEEEKVRIYLKSSEVTDQKNKGESSRRRSRSRNRRGGKRMGVVREWIKKHKVRMIGLVETKAERIKEYEVKRLWGTIEYEWDMVAAENKGGGILCVWEKAFL